MSAHPATEAGRPVDQAPPIVPDVSDAPMIGFALDYARRGIPVFPCNPRNKAPYLEGGFQIATTDSETIKKWWTASPRAMIGVPMGHRSGLWAIDPDPPKNDGDPDGRVIWKGLVEKNGALPATHTEVTPRGGTHILFKWDADRPVTNSPGALKGTNIDVRGEGGYVIMAPSECKGDGSRKNVAGKYQLGENRFQFADAPDWVFDLVLQSEPVAAQPTQAKIGNLLSAFPKPASSEFWRNVNSEALKRITDWAPAAFPQGHLERNTGAWRVPSSALGRDNDEDLSISPKGVKDWGVWDIGDSRQGRRSAIGLLIEHGIASDAVGAAHWLCERCGIDPVTLGWRQGGKSGEDRSVIAQAESIDNGTITQDGIARVFAHRFEDRLRFCHDTGRWYEWTATHWRKDKTDLAFHFCRELAREFTEDSKASELKEVRKISFAGGVEKFARTDRQMAVSSEAWDRDPFLLGTPGGTVDLRTGELREPDPVDGITKVTAVPPAASADCPRWLQFMEETFGDHDLIRFLQQWGGYSLTGATSEHALVFGFGNGKNGKSVWLNTHTGILNDYATTAAMDTFVASRSERHPTDLAMLRGARLVTASETEEGRAWAESRIKQLTGGDPISARFMHQDFFTFRPTFKLTIIGNHRPLLRNVDEAARRRFNLVPFNRVPAQPDPLLEQKFKAEWPGILRWLIEGCLDWQTNGLKRPDSVIKANKDYFEDQDLFSQWLAEACDAEPGNRYKSEAVGKLFSTWTEFATSAGEKPGSVKAFSAELSKRGFERAEAGHSKVRCFLGLMLRRPADAG